MQNILKNKKIIAILSVVLCALIVVITLATIHIQHNNSADYQLSLGEKYLTELNYEEAILSFNKVIKIDPANVDAYLGMAEAYIGLGNEESALDILMRGYEETGDQRLMDKYNEISGVEEVPELPEVTTAPTISPDIQMPVTSMTETDTEIPVTTVSGEVTEEPVTSATEVTTVPVTTTVTTTEPIVQEASNILRSEELLLYGEPIRKMTIDELKVLLNKNGYVAEIKDWSLYREISEEAATGVKMSSNHNKDDEYLDKFEMDSAYSMELTISKAPIGIRDICIEDTIEEVFTKLGIPDGAKMAARIKEAVGWSRLVNADTIKYLQDENIGEYQNDDICIELIDDSHLTYKITVNGQNDYAIFMTFGFYKYIDTLEFDNLTHYRIQFYN